MKNFLFIMMTLVIASVVSSCATIIGGSKYYAEVQVPNHPNAKIEYKGRQEGIGEASFKARRKEANQFSVTIKEEGCETQTADFTERKFRGWAFAGTVIGWTGLYGGIPLPWGVATDLATGALWKPDVNEKGVRKEDFNHFTYTIDYTGCPDNK